MKLKKYNIIFLVISIFLILTASSVDAKNKLVTDIEINKNIIKQGEKVTITLQLPNNDNINVYQAKINYDNNVWNVVKENNFSVNYNWQNLKYNQNNQNFILINKKGITNQDILTINLIAKENALIGPTKIIIDDILASNIDGEYQANKVQTEVEISKKVENNPEDKSENKVVETELSSESSSINKTNNATSKVIYTEEFNYLNNDNNSLKDETVANNSNTSNENSQEFANSKTYEEQEVVDSGQETNKIAHNYIFYIIIVIIILLLMYIILKSKKSTKTLMIWISLALVFGNLTKSNAYSDIFLGDVSGNSLIDNTDIDILEEHLINLKEIVNKNVVDMNQDNKLSIIDLALLIHAQLENPYDTYNLTNITKWEQMPIVSQALLDQEEVTMGGEGCQWPIGMAISKDGKTLLIGTDVGGIYRSIDGGQTFSQANSGLKSRGVGALAIDPNNSDYVIAIGINSSAFDSNGPHISSDGGETWDITKSMLIVGHRDIRDSVIYDESSYNQEENRSMIAYWSTAYETEQNKLEENEKGLYQSLDGGYTWQLINSELSDGTVKVNPYTGDVYVSKSDGIYYSKDKGASFKKIVNSSVTGFDLITYNNQVYIYYCNNEGVYTATTNNNFQKITSLNYPTMMPMNIKVSPIDKNKMILVNKEGTYQNYPYYSLDGGHTWEKSVLDNSLSMMPYNNRASIPLWSPTIDKVWLFVQGDYVSSSIDNGKTFKWDSNGITGILSGGQVHYNVYNPDIIYFGSQDYNGAVSLDGGQTWKYINLAEEGWGGFCYGGYAANETTYFAGCSDSHNGPRKLKITFDGGQTVIDTGLYFTQENLRSSIESSYQSPTNPQVLFAADLRSEDGGKTWQKMTGCINVYTHNPQGKKELYGMDETAQYVVVSYDNGLTWQKVNNEKFQPNANLPALKIDDLAYDWQNENVYVAAGGEYLYRVNKNGKVEYVINKYNSQYDVAPHNFKNKVVITKVAVDPNDPNIIYCGGPGNTYMNDTALYRSVDGGKIFQVVTSNPTNSIIKTGVQGGFETNSLEVNPKTGELLFAGGCFGLSKLLPPY